MHIFESQSSRRLNHLPATFVTFQQFERLSKRAAEQLPEGGSVVESLRTASGFNSSWTSLNFKGGGCCEATLATRVTFVRSGNQTSASKCEGQKFKLVPTTNASSPLAWILLPNRYFQKCGWHTIVKWLITFHRQMFSSEEALSSEVKVIFKLTVITVHQVGCGRAIEVMKEKSYGKWPRVTDTRMQNVWTFWLVESKRIYNGTLTV